MTEKRTVFATPVNANRQDDRRYYYLTLKSVEPEYDDVSTYRFTCDEAVPFQPGHYAHVVAPGQEVSKATVRHMSFASTPDDEEIVFSMEHRSGSSYKKAFAEMAPGETTRMFKIKGEFTVDAAEQSEIIFIAGGIGITPIRSLIRAYGSDQPSIRWTLVHVSRSEYLYGTELSALDFPQYRVRRESFPQALKSAAAHFTDPWYYVSGSEAFLHGMQEILAQRGVTPDRIKTENFDH